MAATKDAYRADIDGLRAIAVLSVVFYHAGVPGFSGGFVGVDVFFVISGYLITRILASELDTGRYSILAFYERRIRRLFPALFAMLGVCLIAGQFLLLPREFDEFAQSLAAATLFVSNIFFWQTTDYFAGPAHLKPLLHTWSLAVEEQFYIVFPVLLAVLHAHARKYLLAMVAVLALVSLALAEWAVHAKPIAAFYLMPARFFELAIGALLALGVGGATVPQWAREVAAGLGLLCLTAAIALFGPEAPFPGLSALIPCFGAALIIWAGEKGTPRSAAILTARPMVGVGLISYSLYLWHWPLLAFARQASGEILSPATIAILVIASFALALLSWHFVEQPFRHRDSDTARGPIFRTALGTMSVALAAGIGIHVLGGLPGRFPEYRPVTIAGPEFLDKGHCFLTGDQHPSDWPGSEACGAASTVGARVVVWGDSFAAHLVHGLRAEGGERLSFVNLTSGGCPPILAVNLPSRPFCREFNERALGEIGRTRPDAVIVAARWESYLPRAASLASIKETLAAIERTGTRIILVGQSPAFDFASPYDYVFRTGRDGARVTFGSELNRDLARIAVAHFFDPMTIVCPEARCPLTEKGAYLYFDGGHFSDVGSRKIAASILGPIRSALNVAEPSTVASETTHLLPITR
ncbi:MAG: acyltransferase family protein [Hyphomicrobium sp.]|nr:acyltransferase family protein [Hyphomicrobium sp.]